MFRQGGSDGRAIDRDRRQPRLIHAEGLRLGEIAPRHKHIMSSGGQPSGYPPAETAIAAEDENMAQSSRDACSGFGSQHVSRLPNSR